MTCRIVDAGTDWRCLTHDVQAEPVWPDAYVEGDAWTADYRCPVGEPERDRT